MPGTIADERKCHGGGDPPTPPLVDLSAFFTSDLTRTLTHLTADMSFLSPLPHAESDYEKWKSVFNVIQGLEELKYFVCIREKDGVFGRFSSLQPLNRALTAVVTMKPFIIKTDFHKWLCEALLMNIPIVYPELLPSSSSSSSCYTLGVKSWCFEIWKKLCCFKSKSKAVNKQFKK